MWPTFYVPLALAAPRVTDCFNLYTKLVSTERYVAAGFEFDPDLQFTTRANQRYWMYGLLAFRQSDPAGSPGVVVNFDHSGTTDGFGSLGSRDVGFGAPLSGNGNFIPIPVPILGDPGYLAETSLSLDTTIIYRVFIDMVLAVGSTPGTFGIKWGVRDALAPGAVTLDAGSYFTAIEINPL